eukprot:g1467.t1
MGVATSQHETRRKSSHSISTTVVETSGRSSICHVVPKLAALCSHTLQPPSAAAGFPFNSYYPLQQFQSLYTASELRAAGLRKGSYLTGIEIRLSQEPYSTFSISVGYCFTSVQTLKSFAPCKQATEKFFPVCNSPTHVFPVRRPGEFVREFKERIQKVLAPHLNEGPQNVVVEWLNRELDDGEEMPFHAECAPASDYLEGKKKQIDDNGANESKANNNVKSLFEIGVDLQNARGDASRLRSQRVFAVDVKCFPRGSSQSTGEKSGSNNEGKGPYLQVKLLDALSAARKLKVTGWGGWLRFEHPTSSGPGCWDGSSSLVVEVSGQYQQSNQATNQGGCYIKRTPGQIRSVFGTSMDLGNKINSSYLMKGSRECVMDLRLLRDGKVPPPPRGLQGGLDIKGVIPKSQDTGISFRQEPVALRVELSCYWDEEQCLTRETTSGAGGGQLDYMLCMEWGDRQYTRAVKNIVRRDGKCHVSVAIGILHSDHFPGSFISVSVCAINSMGTGEPSLPIQLRVPEARILNGGKTPATEGVKGVYVESGMWGGVPLYRSGDLAVRKRANQDDDEDDEDSDYDDEDSDGDNKNDDDDEGDNKEDKNVNQNKDNDYMQENVTNAENDMEEKFQESQNILKDDLSCEWVIVQNENERFVATQRNSKEQYPPEMGWIDLHEFNYKEKVLSIRKKSGVFTNETVKLEDFKTELTFGFGIDLFTCVENALQRDESSLGTLEAMILSGSSPTSSKYFQDLNQKKSSIEICCEAEPSAQKYDVLLLLLSSKFTSGPQLRCDEIARSMRILCKMGDDLGVNHLISAGISPTLRAHDPNDKKEGKLIASYSTPLEVAVLSNQPKVAKVLVERGGLRPFGVKVDGRSLGLLTGSWNLSTPQNNFDNSLAFSNEKNQNQYKHSDISCADAISEELSRQIDEHEVLLKATKENKVAMEEALPHSVAPIHTEKISENPFDTWYWYSHAQDGAIEHRINFRAACRMRKMLAYDFIIRAATQNVEKNRNNSSDESLNVIPEYWMGLLSQVCRTSVLFGGQDTVGAFPSSPNDHDTIEEWFKSVATALRRDLWVLKRCDAACGPDLGAHDPFEGWDSAVKAEYLIGVIWPPQQKILDLATLYDTEIFQVTLETPLHVAVESQHFPAIRSILDHARRIDSNNKNSNDSSPSMAEEKKRIDPSDGKAYTKKEFIECYGGIDEWNNAADAEVVPNANSEVVPNADSVIIRLLSAKRTCGSTPLIVAARARADEKCVALQLLLDAYNLDSFQLELQAQIRAVQLLRILLDMESRTRLECLQLLWLLYFRSCVSTSTERIKNVQADIEADSSAGLLNEEQVLAIKTAAALSPFKVDETNLGKIENSKIGSILSVCALYQLLDAGSTGTSISPFVVDPFDTLQNEDKDNETEWRSHHNYAMPMDTDLLKQRLKKLAPELSRAIHILLSLLLCASHGSSIDAKDGIFSATLDEKINGNGVKPLLNFGDLAYLVEASRLIGTSPDSVKICNTTDGATSVSELLCKELRRVSSISTFLEKRKFVEMQLTWNGGSLLHVACEAANLNALKMLLQRGTFVVTAVDRDGMTPLHALALGTKYSDRSFASTGTGGNIPHRPDMSKEEWMTEQHLHAGTRATIGSILFAEGVDFNARDEGGFTALNYLADPEAVFSHYGTKGKTDMLYRDPANISEILSETMNGNIIYDAKETYEAHRIPSNLPLLRVLLRAGADTSPPRGRSACDGPVQRFAYQGHLREAALMLVAAAVDASVVSNNGRKNGKQNQTQSRMSNLYEITEGCAAAWRFCRSSFCAAALRRLGSILYTVADSGNAGGDILFRFLAACTAPGIANGVELVHSNESDRALCKEADAIATEIAEFVQMRGEGFGSSERELLRMCYSTNAPVLWMSLEIARPIPLFGNVAELISKKFPLGSPCNPDVTLLTQTAIQFSVPQKPTLGPSTTSSWERDLRNANDLAANVILICADPFVQNCITEKKGVSQWESAASHTNVGTVLGSLECVIPLRGGNSRFDDAQIMLGDYAVGDTFKRHSFLNASLKNENLKSYNTWKLDNFGRLILYESDRTAYGGMKSSGRSLAFQLKVGGDSVTQRGRRAEKERPNMKDNDCNQNLVDTGKAVLLTDVESSTDYVFPVAKKVYRFFRFTTEGYLECCQSFEKWKQNSSSASWMRVIVHTVKEEEKNAEKVQGGSTIFGERKRMINLGIYNAAQLDQDRAEYFKQEEVNSSEVLWSKHFRAVKCFEGELAYNIRFEHSRAISHRVRERDWIKSGDSSMTSSVIDAAKLSIVKAENDNLGSSFSESKEAWISLGSTVLSAQSRIKLVSSSDEGDKNLILETKNLVSGDTLHAMMFGEGASVDIIGNAAKNIRAVLSLRSVATQNEMNTSKTSHDYQNKKREINRRKGQSYDFQEIESWHLSSM